MNHRVGLVPKTKSPGMLIRTPSLRVWRRGCSSKLRSQFVSKFTRILSDVIALWQRDFSEYRYDTVDEQIGFCTRVDETQRNSQVTRATLAPPDVWRSPRGAGDTDLSGWHPHLLKARIKRIWKASKSAPALISGPLCRAGVSFEVRLVFVSAPSIKQTRKWRTWRGDSDFSQHHHVATLGWNDFARFWFLGPDDNYLFAHEDFVSHVYEFVTRGTRNCLRHKICSGSFSVSSPFRCKLRPELWNSTKMCTKWVSVILYFCVCISSNFK